MLRSLESIDARLHNGYYPNQPIWSGLSGMLDRAGVPLEVEGVGVEHGSVYSLTTHSLTITPPIVP